MCRFHEHFAALFIHRLLPSEDSYGLKGCEHWVQPTGMHSTIFFGLTKLKWFMERGFCRDWSSKKFLSHQALMLVSPLWGQELVRNSFLIAENYSIFLSLKTYELVQGTTFFLLNVTGDQEHWFIWQGSWCDTSLPGTPVFDSLFCVTFIIS